MQTNFANLEKQAINAALEGAWKKALELNQQILDKRPSDLNARIRLGKALIQTKNFAQATKIFKEILKQDPINQIALKNLEIAKEGKVKDTTASLHPKHLIKEPGTTAEAHAEITKARLKANDFTAGEKLTLKIKKTEVDVIYENEVIGVITNTELVKDLNKAKKSEAKLDASVIKGKEKKLIILIKSSSPVFKSERQDIKPYFKKGTIEDEEPELDMGDDDDEVYEYAEEESE